MIKINHSKKKKKKKKGDRIIIYVNFCLRLVYLIILSSSAKH